MKKTLVLVTSFLLVFLIGIKNVKADVVSMGLKDLVADEIKEMKGIEGTEELVKALEEADLGKYKESDDKVNVYIFRGNTCGFCLKAVVYFSQLAKTMGDKFNIVSYEVWNNNDNSDLLLEAAKVLGEVPGGVPYIIVGDKSFNGYDESFNKDIEAEIKKQYKLKKNKRYDVMVEKDKKPPVYTPLYVFIAVSVVLLIINIVTISVTCVKVKKMQNELSIETEKVLKLNETKKSSEKPAKKTTSKTSKKSK